MSALGINKSLSINKLLVLNYILLIKKMIHSKEQHLIHVNKKKLAFHSNSIQLILETSTYLLTNKKIKNLNILFTLLISYFKFNSFLQNHKINS